MDILDRLTNRQELERRMSSEVEAVFIDAEALAQALKSRVVARTASAMNSRHKFGDG